MYDLTLDKKSHEPCRRNPAEERLEALARASIALSQLAPTLSEIACTVATGAQEQARQSQAISAQAERMAAELDSAVAGLRHSSNSVHDIVETIKRVADQTKILSVNAAIEAARAGHLGAAFGVVAQEVESLSGQTVKATDEISHRVDSIQKDIHAAVEAAGLRDEQRHQTVHTVPVHGINWLSAEVSRIAQIAMDNANASDEVRSTSTRIRSLCEDLLLAVGAFRFPAHRRAVKTFGRVLSHPTLGEMRRFGIEPFLRETIQSDGIFELLYVTDHRGNQITANIWADGRDGANRVGTNWSHRPWFTAVQRSRQIHVSDIYRSQATDNFCFTISGPVTRNGEYVGILAADINFAELIGI